jgi:hypothetical protein
MDGNDASHAGDDSSKHGAIFAGKTAGARHRARMARKTAPVPVASGRPAACLKLVPPGGAGQDAQVRPDRFGGLKLQLDRFAQSLQRPECGHAPAGA